MKKSLFSSLLLLCFCVATSAQTIERLTTEYMQTPVGIDVKQPQFGWQMKSDRYGAEQKAYRLVVSDSEDNLNRGNYVYDSGKTNSGLSVGIKYAGAALNRNR